MSGKIKEMLTPRLIRCSKIRQLVFIRRFFGEDKRRETLLLWVMLKTERRTQAPDFLPDHTGLRYWDK